MDRESLAQWACLGLAKSKAKTKSLEPRAKKPLSYTPAWGLLIVFAILGKTDSGRPMTAISRDPGDYPIFDVSTQSVTLTMGRL
jgi:hypothetical protein